MGGIMVSRKELAEVSEVIAAKLLDVFKIRIPHDVCSCGKVHAHDDAELGDVAARVSENLTAQMVDKGLVRD
jgi:hypothetical protein